jgi:hypothetical protein
MGYTHYYKTTPTIPLDKWVRLKIAVSKLLDGVADIQFEYNKAEPIVIDDKEIRFNGIGDDGHETLYLSRESTPAEWDTDKSTVFNFCKTAYKPYDRYVTAVLTLAKIHLGDDIEISSDGGVADWQEGISFINEKLGKDYAMLENPDSEYPDDVTTAIIKSSIKARA